MTTTTEISGGVALSMGHAPRIIRSVAQLREAVATHSKSPMFSMDVETDGLHHKTNTVLWVGLATAGEVSIIPLGHPNGSVDVPEHILDVPIEGTSRPFLKNPNKFTKPKTRKVRVPATFFPPPQQLRPDIVFEELQPLLLPDQPKTMLGHNVKFDVMSCAKYYGDTYLSDTRLEYADTIVLTHLVDERLPDYKLKPLIGKWLLGRKYANKEIRAAFYPDLGAKILTSSFEDVAQYLARDVYYTWLYWKHLMTKLPPSIRPALAAEMEVYKVVIAMQDRGVALDTQMLDEIRAEVSKDLADIEVEAWKITGRQFPLTNNNIKRDLLFTAPKSEGGQLLTPVAFSKKTNVPQVDKKVVEQLAPTNKLAACFLEHSQVQAKDKFLVQMQDSLLNGRIHTQFNQHRAETGRFSSSEPNLQNVPATGPMRGAFIAAPHHSLVVADYDQIELRCIAYLANDKAMINLFISGEDIHAHAAAVMLGIPPEDVTKELRQIGKTVNFSVGYGATAFRVSNVVGCTVEEAQVFIDRYYREYKAIEPWKKKILIGAIERGDRTDPLFSPPYVEIPPFNRRRRILELFDDNKKVRASGQRQAINAVVQGFASYIMKQAMVDLHRGMTYGHLELQVHDEAVIEVESTYVDQTLSEVVKLMEGVTFNDAPPLGRVPLVASANIGQTWKEGKG